MNYVYYSTPLRKFEIQDWVVAKDSALIYRKYKLVRLENVFEEHTNFLNNYICFHINDSLEISANSTFPFDHLTLPSPFFCPKNLYRTSKFCPNSSVRLCLLPLHPTPGQYSYQGKISKFYRFLKLLNCAASGTAAVRHLVGSAGVYCWNWCCEGVQVRHYCDTLSVRESSSASTICLP